MQPHPPQDRPREPGLTSSASYLPHKKMVPNTNPSAVAEPAIPKAVRWQHCVAASHTFDPTAPPAQLLSLL